MNKSESVTHSKQCSPHTGNNEKPAVPPRKPYRAIYVNSDEEMQPDIPPKNSNENPLIASNENGSLTEQSQALVLPTSPMNAEALASFKHKINSLLTSFRDLHAVIDRIVARNEIIQSTTLLLTGNSGTHTNLLIPSQFHNKGVAIEVGESNRFISNNNPTTNIISLRPAHTKCNATNYRPSHISLMHFKFKEQIISTWLQETTKTLKKKSKVQLARRIELDITIEFLYQNSEQINYQFNRQLVKYYYATEFPTHQWRILFKQCQFNESQSNLE